jgi:hypothetical protein
MTTIARDNHRGRSAAATSLRIFAVCTGLALVAAGVSGSATASNADETPDRVDHDNTFEIARLTGPDSINNTHERWNVYGTDLGSMFEHRGRIYMAFGDTFGAPGHPPEFGDDWRSNAMAVNPCTNSAVA